MSRAATTRYSLVIVPSKNDFSVEGLVVSTEAVVTSSYSPSTFHSLAVITDRAYRFPEAFNIKHTDKPFLNYFHIPCIICAQHRIDDIMSRIRVSQYVEIKKKRCFGVDKVQLKNLETVVCYFFK